MDNSAVMYNADYRKRLPSEPYNLWKVRYSAEHIIQQIHMFPYIFKSALLSLITLSTYILMSPILRRELMGASLALYF